MHVGIITYQAGHLKAYELIRNLMCRMHTITVFAFPFQLRPQVSTHFQDRPYAIIDFDVKDFCRRFGIRYIEVPGWEPQHAEMLGAPGGQGTPDIYLHCIAKIVPQSFIEGRTILNCHPGLLPQNRGVDAFKWSLVNGWPIGITLHIIDKEIDRGVILARMRVPVMPNDRLQDVCQRAYDFEISLMSAFDVHLANRTRAWEVGDDHPCSHRRIPQNIDQRIESFFFERRELMVRLSTDLSQQPHPADVFGDALRGVTNNAAVGVAPAS